MFFFITLIIFLCALVYYWVQNRFKFWSDRGFESAPTAFFFGNLKDVGSKFTQFQRFDEIYSKYKGKMQAVGVYFFTSPVLMVLDLDFLKNVYIRDFTSFHDRGFYYNKEDDPLSANLLTLEGQEWRDRRTKLSPVFTSGKMKMMFDIVDAIGDNFIEAFDKEISINEEFNVQKILPKYTTDVISNVAFGIDSNCLKDPNSEFYKKGQRLFDFTTFEFLKLFLTAMSPDLARKFKVAANPKESTDFLLQVFSQTIKEREEREVHRNDFVQLLMNIRESLSMTTTEMAAEAFIFFVGGFETSSTALTYALYELALNQEIQQRLRTEVQDGLEENNGKLTYDLLFNFKYLDCVVKETLRKYPVIPSMLRRCTKEYQIPGTEQIIPVKTNVLIPIYSIHHDPDNYPSPEKFDPDRFTPENSRERNPMAFMAFGDGPRNCIGERFGMLQVKLALVKLLTNFEFSACSKTTVPMKYKTQAPFIAPIDGMTLKIKRI